MTLPVLCLELIREWKAVQRFLTIHAPRQQGQGVLSRVSNYISLIVMLHDYVGYP